MPKFTFPAVLAAIVSALVALAAPQAGVQAPCAVAPSSPAAVNYFSPEQELALGRFLAKTPVDGRASDAEPVAAYLTAVGHRLTAAMPPPGLEVHYWIVKSPLIDAFSLPGNVYVTSSLVAQIHTPSEMAGLLAHELGHLAVHAQAAEVSSLLHEMLGWDRIPAGVSIPDLLDRITSAAERDPRHARDVIKQQTGDDAQETADAWALHAMATAGYSVQEFPTLLARISPSAASTWLSRIFQRQTPTEERLRAMQAIASDLTTHCAPAVPSTPSDLATFRTWQNTVALFQPPTPTAVLPGLIRKVTLEGVPPSSPVIAGLRFSPDGNFLLVHLITGSYVVVQNHPMHIVFTATEPSALDALFSADSKSLAFAGRNNLVRVLDLSSFTWNTLATLHPASPCVEMALAPDLAHLACRQLDRGLTILTLPAGHPVFHRDNFFSDQGRDPIDVLDMTLFQGEYDRMQFSSDGHYFLAHGGRGGSAAFDCQLQAELKIPQDVRSQLNDSFVLVGSDEILIAPPPQPKNSNATAMMLAPLDGRFELRRFPAFNKLADYVGEPPLQMWAATAPDRVFTGPFHGEYSLTDVKTQRTLATAHAYPLDAHGNTFALQLSSGAIALSDHSDGRVLESIRLPSKQALTFGAAAMTLDARWLAASSYERAQVWDLVSGKSTMQLRPFSKVWANPDGTLTADYRDDPQHPGQMGRIDPAHNSASVGAKLAPGAMAGPYLIVVHPNTSALSHLEPCHFLQVDYDPFDCDVNVEVHRASNDQLLWSVHFAHSRASYDDDAAANLMALYWPADLGDTRKLIEEHFPQWKFALKSNRDHPGAVFVEYRDLATGKVRGSNFLDSHSDGNLRLAGTNLFLTHDDFTEVFRASTGARLGEMDAVMRSFAPSHCYALAHLPNQHELEVYNLTNFQLATRLVFPTAIKNEVFSDDSQHLLVLTEDNTAYLFDAHQWLPSLSACSANQP